MFRLIQFEIKKLFKLIFFRIILMALLLFFLAYYVFIYINTVSSDDEITKLESSIQKQAQSLAEREEKLETAEGGEAAEIQREIDFWKDWLEKDKATLQYYKEEDWASILQQEIEKAEQTAGGLEYTGQTHTYTYPTLFTAQSYGDKSNWMIDKKVTPLFPVGEMFWITLYDREFLSEEGPSEEIKDLYIEQSKQYSASGLYYLYHFFGIFFGIIGAVTFLFLIGDIVTKEGFIRDGPINLLRTQPIHRNKILVSKFITVMLLSFLVLLTIVLLSFMIGTIFDRFGDWEYPILIYGEDRTFTFMTLGMFLLKSTGMFLLILLFCFSILFLFSILTKRVLITMGLTLSVFVIGIRWSEELMTSSFAHLVPFHYFKVFDVISNEFALTMDNFNFSYMNGLISLGVSSLVILFITYGISIIQNRNIASRVGVRR
jgi:ABC-type transport system involved in multi-copper enzyme maturation permease subunit